MCTSTLLKKTTIQLKRSELCWIEDNQIVALSLKELLHASKELSWREQWFEDHVYQLNPPPPFPQWFDRGE